MDNCINWLKDYNEILMLIITAIYVIATVLICWFNANSAKYSKKQLEEMKSQHQDDTRLSLLPVFSISVNGGLINKTIERGSDMVQDYLKVLFTNIGNGTARNIRINLDLNDIGENEEHVLERYLAVGKTATYEFLSFHLPDTGEAKIEMVLRFTDLLNNEYAQVFNFELKNTSGVLRFDNCECGEVAIVVNK